MAAERSSFDPELQARFVDSFAKSTQDVRLVPEALFSAEKNSANQIVRLYRDVNKRGIENGFRIREGVFYYENDDIPYLAVKMLGKKQSIELNLPTKGRDSLIIKGVSEDYSFNGLYYPRSGKSFASLEVLQLEKGLSGQEGYIDLRTPYMSEAEERGITDEFFSLTRGMIYNRETRKIEVRVEDKVLRIADQAPVGEILERYFPKELRDNPFEADVEHDVWARSDWMSDFGISWNRVVEVPVFSAN